MQSAIKNASLQLNTINTILFDFDGTIADTEASMTLALKLTFEDFGIILPGTTVFKTFACLTIEDMFRVAGIFDPGLMSDMVTRYNALYQEIAPRNAGLFSGVLETLDRLTDRGYRLAIATNESRENLNTLMDCFGIKPYFIATCCADEVNRPKPWPDMGKKLLTQTEATAVRTLMVGDAVTDIEMAQRNFMNSCAVGWGSASMNRLLEASPNWAIYQPSELFDILDNAISTPAFLSILKRGTVTAAEPVL
jgi:phosphoglycolate phosphatase